MIKIIGVWLLVMVVASGIAVVVNIWLTNSVLAPVLIGVCCGAKLGVWSHSQCPQNLTDTK